MGIPIWTRQQVANRILAGETLVVLRNKVLRIPQSWLHAHPGGSLAILHFVGRNATDEVAAFHSDETLRRIKGYEVAEIEVTEHGWTSLLPPVMSGWVRKIGKDGKMGWYREAVPLPSSEEKGSYKHPAAEVLLVHEDDATKQTGPTLATLEPGASSLSPQLEAKRSEAYTKLHQRIIDAGFYQCRFLTGYGPEIARYLTFIVISIVAYSKSWFVTSAFFLGLFWHQVTFTAHDLGHVGVTHNWTIDRIIGICIADFMGGLSIGWWVDVSVVAAVGGCITDTSRRTTTRTIVSLSLRDAVSY